MIAIDLKCPEDHLFEVWFRDNETCAKQIKAKNVPCPVCGATKVQKALMAPAVAGAKKKEDNTPAIGSKATLAGRQAVEVKQALRELRKTVEDNFDYVGKDFAEEARKIHYGETDAHNIYGETSAQEAVELHEEGIDVAPIPWVSKDDA